MRIPLNKPYWGESEKKAAVKAISTTLGTGDGPNSVKAQALLREIMGAKYAYVVTSCTHALEAAMIALNLQRGDEVIMPSFTMTSTANCVALRGAKPVFCDIEDKSYCIDPDKIEKLVTNKTKGIIAVHYAGIPAQMEKINRIASKYNLFVVEDAAHDIGTKYKGKSLGTLGDIGCFSFHGTKNISCGEGGAIVTNKKELAEKIEIVRANGTNRSQYIRGEIDKYSWMMEGSSYFLSDILASILFEQLKKVKKVIEMRTKIANIYLEFFSAYENILVPPHIPVNVIPNWHIFGVKFMDIKNAEKFYAFMRKKGVEVSYHYVPLHNSVMGKRISKKSMKLPVTDDVAVTLIRLPVYPGLTAKEVKYILNSAKSVFEEMEN